MLSDSFGDFLRHLRKQAGMTQGDLAAATGYSVSFISGLECGTRAPNIDQITLRFVSALGLQDEPRLAANLIELAAFARGVKPPIPLVVPLQGKLISQAEENESGVYLPIPPTEMVGREGEVKLLCNRLMGHRGRLMTLTGPPGVGKTRLALEIAGRLARVQTDGVKFVSLTALHEPTQLAPALLTTFGLPIAGRKPATSRLISHLRHKRMLLVMDNFEQLLSGSERNPATTLIATLASECPDLLLIVTSRERLHLRAEQRHKVAPLDLDAAVELFLQRAQTVDSLTALTDGERPTLRAICRQLDCLPLAIELAAARLDLLTPTAILAHVQERRLDVLVNGPVDLPPHQRTLRTAIESSYTLLTEEEQKLFCDLGVFVGSFDSQAVIALGRSELLLESLIGKSLVFAIRLDGEPRFSMLETLREFALENLVLSGREQTTRKRFARYFGGLAETTSSRLDSSQRGRKLDQLEAEYGNLSSTLDWCVAHDPGAALAMAVALEPFWLARGYGHEAEQRLSDALAHNLPPTALRAHGLLALSSFCRRSGDMARAREALAQAEHIAVTEEDPSVWLKFYDCAGWHYYDLHDYPRTFEHFEQGLALARVQDDPAQIVRFLTAIVHLHHDLPDERSRIMGRLNECLMLLRDVDDPASLAFVLQQFGMAETAAEDYTSAQYYYRKMLGIHRSAGNKLGEAWGLGLLAETAWFQGDLPRAQQLYEEAHTLFVEQDNVDGVMIVLHHLGQIARKQSRFLDAVTYYCGSLNSASMLNNRHMIARCLAGLGGVELGRASMEQAAFLISAAHQLFDSLPPFLAPYDLDELERQTASVRAASHLATVSAAWDMGQTTPVEQIVFATLMKMGDT